MPAFSILLRDKTLFGESAYKIIIYAVIAWTIHSKHNTFLLKSPPRPLCCAVLKIRPICLYPRAAQLSTGFWAKISNCRTKRNFPVLQGAGQKMPSISRRAIRQKRTIHPCGAYCVLVVLSKQNSIFQDYAGY